MDTPTGRDERLWRLAKKRASFRKSLITYIIFSAIMWIIWWLTRGRTGDWEGVPWPVWGMLGWGIAIVFGFVKSYGGDSEEEILEKEYEKLKKQQERRSS